MTYHQIEPFADPLVVFQEQCFSDVYPLVLANIKCLSKAFMHESEVM